MPQQRTSTSTNRDVLAEQDILDGYSNDEWWGFGYLDARRNALDSSDPESPAQPEAVRRADAAIIAYANAQQWSRDELFTWLNSKSGRYFGDVVLGSASDDDDAGFMLALGAAVSFGLLRKVTR